MVIPRIAMQGDPVRRARAMAREFRNSPRRFVPRNAKLFALRNPALTPAGDPVRRARAMAREFRH